jgi:Diaminopimelate decarboxylase
LKAGFEPQNILYTSNNIAFEEIEEAKTWEFILILIAFPILKNSEKIWTYLSCWCSFASEYYGWWKFERFLRHADSKFGVPLESIREVLDVVKETNLHIRTLHIHTGSEIKDVEVFAKALKYCLK